MPAALLFVKTGLLKWRSGLAWLFPASFHGFLFLCQSYRAKALNRYGQHKRVLVSPEDLLQFFGLSV
jgi:hypothetical protein